MSGVWWVDGSCGCGPVYAMRWGAWWDVFPGLWVVHVRGFGARGPLLAVVDDFGNLVEVTR